MSTSIETREVWNHNLEQEFSFIRETLDDFPYIAIDFVYLDVDVPPPAGTFDDIANYNYQSLKDKVDASDLIQLGLTFFDKDGNRPLSESNNPCIWQFNCEDLDSNRFAELLMSSGVVMNDTLKWVTFHGAYNYGYMLKLLTQRELPDSLSDFFSSIKLYFPMLYDVKHMMKFCNFHGGLHELADLLEVQRDQAGSDSLLTCRTFVKVKDTLFNGRPEKYAGVLFGFGPVNNG